MNTQDEYPYTVESCEMATHHQGDFRYSDFAGKQCTCNSLMALLLLKNNSKISLADLDMTLCKGNKLYNHVQNYADPETGYLSFQDLPNSITLGDNTFKINRHKTYHVFHKEIFSTKKKTCVSINKAICHSDLIFNDLLVMIGIYAISVFYYDGKYHVFDPHPRNEKGKFQENGKAVLLKLPTLDDLKNFIADYMNDHCTDGRPTAEIQQISHTIRVVESRTRSGLSVDLNVPVPVSSQPFHYRDHFINPSTSRVRLFRSNPQKRQMEQDEDTLRRRERREDKTQRQQDRETDLKSKKRGL